jgi:predicted GH43/DUF377 family glycosyl hydrolase
MKYDAAMLDIGREKQVFVDDLIIESVEHVCRTWHQPVRSSANPVLFRDKPWENITYFTFNSSQVIRDPKDGLFKCIYQTLEISPQRGESPLGKIVSHLLYAESEDGIHWRKPCFDIHMVNGEKTNIVIPNAMIVSYVLNPHEPDETKRFKALYLSYLPRKGEDADRVVAATSGDLIHWTNFPERPVFGRAGSRKGDANGLSYDPAGRIYVLHMRHYDIQAAAINLNNPVLEEWSICPPHYPLDWSRGNKRRVWQSESSDLIHWSEPYSILTPEDGEDGVDETFYGFCQFPVGSVMMGFLPILDYVSNTMRSRLAYSRDGKTWHHLNKRQPFLVPRGEGNWDSYMVTLSHGPIEVGNELYIYFGGASNHHDWWMTGAREGLEVPEATDRNKVNYAMGLAKMRRDGFVSLDAKAPRRGILITRPVISDGKQLVINGRCHHAGCMAAEVVSMRDEVFPGYSRQECDIFKGDEIGHVFSWRGKTELPPVRTQRADYPKPEFERYRKFRFYMDNVELYSLTIA